MFICIYIICLRTASITIAFSATCACVVSISFTDTLMTLKIQRRCKIYSNVNVYQWARFCIYLYIYVYTYVQAVGVPFSRECMYVHTYTANTGVNRCEMHLQEINKTQVIYQSAYVDIFYIFKEIKIRLTRYVRAWVHVKFFIYVLVYIILVGFYFININNENFSR